MVLVHSVYPYLGFDLGSKTRIYSMLRHMHCATSLAVCSVAGRGLVLGADSVSAQSGNIGGDESMV